MNNLRLRSLPDGDGSPLLYRAGGLAPEVRDGRRLCCYAAVFDVPSGVIREDGRTFREVIRPGAFTRSLASGRDVYACIEHDPATAFARRSTGLMLQEDGRGLFWSCWLPPSEAADQVLTKVRSGGFRGCSFAFRPKADRWSGGPPVELCELLDVELIDVTLTARPAYPRTDYSVRSNGNRLGQRLRLAKLRR